MQVKVVNLPFRSELGGFDDGPLERFLAGKEVLHVAECFFSVDDRPHLACVVQWQAARQAQSTSSAAVAAPPKPRRSQRASPKLKEREVDTRPPRRKPSSTADDSLETPLGGALRSWRAQRARELGVPAYRVLTNRQIGALAERRPAQLDDLRALAGFGPATVAAHGETLLSLIRSTG
jgi:superfamily II DNA helicase RecQ